MLVIIVVNCCTNNTSREIVCFGILFLSWFLQYHLDVETVNGQFLSSSWVNSNLAVAISQHRYIGKWINIIPIKSHESQVWNHVIVWTAWISYPKLEMTRTIDPSCTHKRKNNHKTVTTKIIIPSTPQRLPMTSPEDHRASAQETSAREKRMVWINFSSYPSPGGPDISCYRVPDHMLSCTAINKIHNWKHK